MSNINEDKTLEQDAEDEAQLAKDASLDKPLEVPPLEVTIKDKKETQETSFDEVDILSLTDEEKYDA